MTPLAYLCPSCGRLSPERGRCAECRRPADQRRNKRPTARGVYNTSRWRALRAHTLADATECEVCGRPPTSTDPLTAGHIEPFTDQHDPLAWDPTNLRAEHRSCNSREAARRQATR